MDLLWIMVCLYGFPILLIVVIGLIAAWVIWEHWLTPRESKMIRRASRKKKPIVWLAGDDGYADVQVLEVFGREGYAATSKDSKKWIGFFARSQTDEKEESDEGKSKAKRLAAFMNRLSSRKLFLRGAKIPVWFSYSGKAILTSLYSLIGLDLAKEIVKANPKPKSNPTAIVDLVEVKSLFDKPWDESQQRANEEDARIEGMSEGKKFFGLEGWKPLVIPVGIILALIMGVIVLSVVFLR